MGLTRDQILQAKNPKPIKVEVPEWGGDVYIRSMSSKQRDDYEADAAKGIDRKNFRARMVAMTACDEEGNLLFTEEDIEALAEKDCKPMSRLLSIALDLNSFNEEDVVSLEKN